MNKSKNMPKLIVYRKNELVNMSDAYELYINDKKKAELQRGKKTTLKLKSDFLKLRAQMSGGYTSEEVNIKAKPGDTVRLKVSGFRFQQYILPFFAISIPFWVLLRESGVVSGWLILPVVVPVAAYAFYFYVLRRDRSLRIEVMD
jgi:hypothetical protein